MGHTDDSYAAMLLTMALSPDKEEYARPLGAQEFRRFESAARASRFGGIGALLDVDISGLMIYLGLSEQEAYRAYTLMHRGVQLAYALEGFSAQGIDVVTQYDAGYPRRARAKLREAAPPFLYRCGNPDLLDQPAVAILGVGGVRTAPEARQLIQALVRAAVDHGYAVITGGEPGVSRQAAGQAAECRGRLVEILAGGLREHIGEGAFADMNGEGRALALSQAHPEALFTVSHAAARNRLLFAMADAAFVFNTDGRRGELDALQSRACNWIYAWEGSASNRALIARGASPFSGEGFDFDALSAHWSSSSAQQLSIFDMLGKL